MVKCPTVSNRCPAGCEIAIDYWGPGTRGRYSNFAENTTIFEFVGHGNTHTAPKRINGLAARVPHEEGDFESHGPIKGLADQALLFPRTRGEL